MGTEEDRPEEGERLLGSGRTAISDLGTPMTYRLDGTTVELMSEAMPYPMRSAPIADCTFSGPGRVEAHGTDLLRPAFEPVEQPFDVHLSVANAMVLEARGMVGSLSVTEGAACTGDPTKPLVVWSIGSVDGAILQNLDLYELSLRDVAKLRHASVVAPWLPRRGLAKAREDAPRGSTAPDPAVQRWARAQYWAEFNDVLAEKHAPGATRSEARYAMHRARRLAIPWGRERFLLSAYRLLGYGERFIHPTVALLVMTLLGGFVVTGNHDFHLLPQTWIGLLGAPLSFFGFAHSPVVTGWVDQLTVLVDRVVGLLLYVLALNSLRKVLRAE